MSKAESLQIQIFHEFHRGIREKDLDLIKKHLHDDFRRQIYPRSLNQPEQTKDETVNHFEMVIKFSFDFEVIYISRYSDALPQLITFSVGNPFYDRSAGDSHNPRPYSISFGLTCRTFIVV